MKAIPRFELVVFASIFAVCPVRLHAQASALIERELVWSLPGTEIDSVKFSPDGNFIVLVNRAHWPDGHDAEGLPDAVFRNLAEKEKRNPRFADPVVKLIGLNGKVVCEAAYGWNPDVSADNKALVYSRQKSPITGLRVLAETQAGNDIELLNCENKESQRIAEPQSGYFDNPIFFDSINSIAYTENEATNGAYASAVAFGRFDATSKRISPLLNKVSIPAVPCPTPGSGESDHDYIICSQAKNRTMSFPQLVLQFDSTSKQLLALLATPIPSMPDMWLASNYDVRLVSLAPEPKQLLDFGKRTMGELDDTAFELVSEQRVLIFSHHWKTFFVA